MVYLAQGNDHLDLGAGDDYVYGNTFGNGSDHDTVIGGGGRDTLDLLTFSGGLPVGAFSTNIVATTADGFVTLTWTAPNWSGVITLRGVETLVLGDGTFALGDLI